MTAKSISIIQSNGKLFIDGREVEKPTKNSSSNSISVINNKVYVDGYELKDGKWKRTLTALWHKYF